MELSKRNLLLDLMLAELGERGYADSSLPAVLKAAGVSEREFHEEFDDADACLFAAYERLADEIVRRAREACAGGGDWPARVRAALSTLLDSVAANPLEAAVVTQAFPAISPEAHMRYSALLSRLATLLRDGREYSGVGGDLPAGVELLAIGFAESLVFEEIDAGRACDLPDLMPEILFSILVPFVGPERATAEMRETVPLAA